MLYSFVIAVGIWLGKIKVFGISLGVTFVLFVGIVCGEFGYIVDGEVLKFVREFGLIIFIFAIGLQVGPGFFSAFKTGGVRLNMLAVLAILLNVAIVVGIYFYERGNTPIAALVGVMSGAVTNTPGLAAAQQAMQDNPDAVNTMSMGYAAAYPLGVVGIIMAMLVIKGLFRINVDDEIKEIEADLEKTQLKPLILTYEVHNRFIEGKTMAELHDIIQCNFVVSRILRGADEVIIPVSGTQVHKGDKLRVVLSPQDEQRFEVMIGPEIEMQWDDVDESHDVVSRRIVITKSQYNGVALGSLRLHNGYNLNATRVNRAGVDLLAAPNLRLQMGDRITVVGSLHDIDRLAAKMGNSLKRLNQPNLITIFVGILLGIVLGSVNLGFSMKLGLAGGPLVVAILLSRFGYKLKLVTYTSSSASLMLRELGICLFLASVGISAGKGFSGTVFSYQGMWWVIWGFIITFVPLIVVGVIARGVYKINYLTIMGLFSGGYTDPPALAYASNSTSHDQTAVAYSTVYPLTMFMRVVAAQVLVLAFM